MKKTVTIKSNRDFQRLYRRGKSAVSPTMVLYWQKNRFGESRLGLTTGTKLGKAVVRNRVRRRFREIYRLNEDAFQPGWDIVVVVRSKSIDADFQKLTAAYLQLAEKAGILRTN